jgi:hypothetical protein
MPDVGIPIKIFSDPRLWIKSIPAPGDADEIYDQAAKLAGGPITRPGTDDDLRAKFVRDLLKADSVAMISEADLYAIGSFICAKTGPAPVVSNLHFAGGVEVCGAVEMFYRDPDSVAEARDEPLGAGDESAQTGEDAGHERGESCEGAGGSSHQSAENSGSESRQSGEGPENESPERSDCRPGADERPTGDGHEGAVASDGE